MLPPTATISAPNGAEDKRFPAPLASHEQVVNQCSLFWSTLKSFHLTLGSKFKIPVIGGKELDLHVLYVEVTRRGGFDKVVKKKRWSDVGTIFKFSPTTTSVSYVLKKHYSSILRHYEQVYFFQKQSPLLSQTAIGYLVTVKVGSEILHGVLYPEQPSSSMPTVKPCNATVLQNHPKLNQRSRRIRKGGRDPNRPKPNRSGYNFFFADKHSELKSLYPHRKREFTKMIGESWNNLNPEKREVYQNIGLKDKERYKKEMKKYTERMKFGQPKEAERASH